MAASASAAPACDTVAIGISGPAIDPFCQLKLVMQAVWEQRLLDFNGESATLPEGSSKTVTMMLH